MSDPEPERIDLDKIQSGPIRHGSLSDKMLEQIRWVYEYVGSYLETTLEQFEISFMRDLHPEDEILMWTCITAAWMDYHEEHLNDEVLPDEEEKKLIGALIAISTGVEDPNDLDVPVEVGQKLIACYDALETE